MTVDFSIYLAYAMKHNLGMNDTDVAWLKNDLSSVSAFINKALEDYGLNITDFKVDNYGIVCSKNGLDLKLKFFKYDRIADVNFTAKSNNLKVNYGINHPFIAKDKRRCTEKTFEGKLINEDGIMFMKKEKTGEIQKLYYDLESISFVASQKKCDLIDVTLNELQELGITPSNFERFRPKTNSSFFTAEYYDSLQDFTGNLNKKNDKTI